MPFPYNFLKKLSQHGKEENEYNKENNRRSWIIAYNQCIILFKNQLVNFIDVCNTSDIIIVS